MSSFLIKDMKLYADRLHTRLGPASGFSIKSKLHVSKDNQFAFAVSGREVSLTSNKVPDAIRTIIEAMVLYDFDRMESSDIEGNEFAPVRDALKTLSSSGAWGFLAGTRDRHFSWHGAMFQGRVYTYPPNIMSAAGGGSFILRGLALSGMDPLQCYRKLHPYDQTTGVNPDCFDLTTLDAFVIRSSAV